MYGALADVLWGLGPSFFTLSVFSIDLPACPAGPQRPGSFFRGGLLLRGLHRDRRNNTRIVDLLPLAVSQRARPHHTPAESVNTHC